MEKPMRLFKFWLPAALVAISLSASAAYASCDCSDQCHNLNDRDFDAVTEFLDSKRSIDLLDKAQNLTISGDVRAEWNYADNRVNGQRRRGGHSLDGKGRDCDGVTSPTTSDIYGSPTGARIPNSEFLAELNLRFDYQCERTWAVAHLQFSNPMGAFGSHKRWSNQCDDCGCSLLTGAPAGSACEDIDNQAGFGSGRCNNICLKRAYFGYNFCSNGCSRFDIEVGRRRFYDVFDSRIEFNEQFDGILLRYTAQLECASAAYLNLAGFVIDQRSDHFGWALEAGLINIYDTGVDFKYSYIDWLQKGRSVSDNVSSQLANGGRSLRNVRGWDFQVHQFLAYYNLDECISSVPAKLYGAFLFNAHAKRHPATATTNYVNKNNIGWYVGALFGEVCREGDWSLDINYQYVQAQAVPDSDVSGIGRDNVLCETFTGPTQRGNANFKGVRMEGLYAITDNLTLDAILQAARSVDKNLGGKLNYFNFRLAAIYAF